MLWNTACPRRTSPCHPRQQLFDAFALGGRVDIQLRFELIDALLHALTVLSQGGTQQVDS